MQPQWILACDIDYTLTGDTEALVKLAEQLTTLRRRGELFLILPTARTIADVLPGFDEEGLPVPDAIITLVGTEIYLPPFSNGMARLPEWDAQLRQSFSRAEALTFLEDIEGLRMQSDRYNTVLKVSCFLDQTSDPPQAAALIKRRVIEAGKADVYQLIWSSGRDLDIIPAKAGKGKAVKFILQHLNLTPQRVVVAGDTGNDRTMFEEFLYGIVVGNAQPELKQLRDENPGPTVYFAQKSYAAGVEEGLQHFGLL